MATPTVWSRSPHATADIFLELKRNQDEPDAAAAVLVGLPPGANNNNGPAVPASETIVNQPAMDLLRRLPGVTDANFRPLMAAMGSLRWAVGGRRGGGHPLPRDTHY